MAIPANKTESTKADDSTEFEEVHILHKLRLGAQSVTLLSTLRDPTQLGRLKLFQNPIKMNIQFI